MAMWYRKAMGDGVRLNAGSGSRRRGGVQKKKASFKTENLETYFKSGRKGNLGKYCKLALSSWVGRSLCTKTLEKRLQITFK